MKRRTFRIIVSLLYCITSFQTFGSTLFQFQTELEIDKNFVEKNQNLIELQAKKLENFWQVNQSEQVIVAIMPFSTNPNFLNCARIYGTKKIYIHSPDSLARLEREHKDKINPFCLKHSYDDVQNTIAHEYSHILNLILSRDHKPMQWIWEGSAQYLSGEMKSDKFLQSVKYSLKDFLEIDLCKVEPELNKSYQLGALAIAYYEKMSPGIIKLFASITSPSEAGKVIRLKNLSCTLEKQKLMEMIL